MSTSTATRPAGARFAPKAFQALVGVNTALKDSTLGIVLIDLVFLRVSQINGCAYCVDLHWRDLIAADQDPRALNAVAAWREAPFFDARQRAALAGAETVTDLHRNHVSDEDFNALRPHFNDAEIAELSIAVALMNAWNRIAISLRSPEVV
jgi:AhpD family alkylhydroperoxidase